MSQETDSRRDAIEAQLSEQVAWACRILAGHGYADLTLGHVSVRAEPDRIYIKRKGVMLSEVTPADVLTTNLGDTLAEAPADMHLESVLHTEVYKRRPDVGCVIHGHPLYATAFGATDARLEVLTHDAVRFARGGIATFDGAPDLIVDERQGAEVAGALGEASALLLRNHGVLVAERDVQWAVLSAVLLEKSAQLQSVASTLGNFRPIPDDLIAALHDRKYQAGFATEYWDAWVRELRRSGGAFGMPGEQERGA